MVKQYTDSQNKAVKWNDGPVVVLAGPGSGKTTVLTDRIRRIFKETPDDTFRILALTFTNKAAQEMNKRIRDGIGDIDHRLYVGTFHSFCYEVLRNHGSYVDLKADFDICRSNDDLNYVVEGICNDYKTKEDASFPSEELKLLKIINYFESRLCFSEEDVEENMPHTEYSSAYKWIYMEYLHRMLNNSTLDYNMLIMLTYKLFKSRPVISRVYAKTYRYINVDEFQDTNYGQYMVLVSMCGAINKNIFVVADDDQVIYGWNGADYRRISQFKETYEAELIQLNQNFRCPKEVISAANNLISHNSGREKNKKPLEAMGAIADNNTCIVCQQFEDQIDEAHAIVGFINSIKSKNPKETICVLSRTNRLLELPFIETKQAGIVCEKSKRTADFQNPYVLFIFLSLKLANHRNDKRVLREIVGVLSGGLSFNIDEEEVILGAELTDGDLLKALRAKCLTLFDDGSFGKSFSLNLVEGKNFIRYIDDAFKWAELQISKITNEVNKDQEYQDYIIEKKAWKDFQRHLNYRYNLDEILLSTYMQEFSITAEEDPREDAVQFLTIHASKGKEFDHVILMGMANDVFPSYQSLKRGFQSAEMEEERRNCFVAITRAKKALYLTYSQKYFGWKKEKSIFIDEMSHSKNE